MAESREHRELKRWSSRWLREQGYVAVGIEVADSTGRFRVDVAGWTDREVGRRGLIRARPRSVLVECKRSRGDYLRDVRCAAGLLARRDELLEALEALGASATSLFPSEAQGHGTLFDDMARSDRRPSRNIRRLRVELTAIERRLFRGVKFAKLVRWHGATRMWIAAPTGMLSPTELPMGWGLLEIPKRVLNHRVPEGIPATEVATIKKRPWVHDVSGGALDRLLRNIAIANSRFVGGSRVVARSRMELEENSSKSVCDVAR